MFWSISTPQYSVSQQVLYIYIISVSQCLLQETWIQFQLHNHITLLETNNFHFRTRNTQSQNPFVLTVWWSLTDWLFNNWLCSCPGDGRFRSISQISIRNICVTDADTVRTCYSVYCVVVMKFLNEVSHVSPYFKVHWTKCSVLKRSEGIPPVILSRPVGQLQVWSWVRKQFVKIYWIGVKQSHHHSAITICQKWK